MSTPFASFVNVLIVSVLLGGVCALEICGFIAERTALKCYLAIVACVILFITATGSWWALALAVPSAMIFVWALATTGEEEEIS